LLKPWIQRSIEEANLLNPAFCCVVLNASFVGYVSIYKMGIPYPLVFMVLPIVLHKPTRERLPRSTRTSLAAWIQENAETKVLYAERLMALKPHTREAIRFGLFYNWLVFEHNGQIHTNFNNSSVTRITHKMNNEARECVMRAKFVGKWLASAGSVQTVMALWGIRP